MFRVQLLDSCLQHFDMFASLPLRGSQDRHRIIRMFALGRADTCLCFPGAGQTSRGGFFRRFARGRVHAVAPRD